MEREASNRERVVDADDLAREKLPFPVDREIGGEVGERAAGIAGGLEAEAFQAEDALRADRLDRGGLAW